MWTVSRPFLILHRVTARNGNVKLTGERFVFYWKIRVDNVERIPAYLTLHGLGH